MKIWDYLGISQSQFRTDYVETRLVDVAKHDVFPLEMLTYGREAVHSNHWDSVTRKCRGVIFDTTTEEIIARPFEKFFNLKTANMPETDPSTWSYSQGDDVLFGEPEVWEKMDGFLCTAYAYNGQWYVASKGSFDSMHAKWATAQIRRTSGHWPSGYTPVFEGICSSIRIVVDYEKFEGLVLLALVNLETGEELAMHNVRTYALANGIETPHVYDLTWQDASKKSLDTEVENFEGYVLVWRRPGQTPFRLKVKYVDYLRLHRMVSGVSAKAIYRGLSDPTYKGELDEWINDSTPWFSKFVAKWVRALTTRHDELINRANRVFRNLTDQALDSAKTYDRIWGRKDWAEKINDGNKDISGILFAMLDGKDASAVAWKLTKPLIKDSLPMINASVLR